MRKISNGGLKAEHLPVLSRTQNQLFLSLDLISIKYFNQIFEPLLNVVQNQQLSRANFGSLRMQKKEIIPVPTPVFSPSFFARRDYFFCPPSSEMLFVDNRRVRMIALPLVSHHQRFLERTLEKKKWALPCFSNMS